MYSLFESFILHEAVPKKAKELGIEPDAPPDMNEDQPDMGNDTEGGGDNPSPDDGSDIPDKQPPPEDGGDDPTQDTGEDGGDPDASGDGGDMGDDQNLQPPDDLAAAEQELFKDLKPEQIEIKKKELKMRYQDLYQITSDTLEKMNKITKTSYDANMIDLCIKQLLKIKDMIHQIVIHVYPTRTYVENKIDLEKLATLFNSITTTIGIIYESRMKRAALDKKKAVRFRDLNIDFHQDLGF